MCHSCESLFHEDDNLPADQQNIISQALVVLFSRLSQPGADTFTRSEDTRHWLQLHLATQTREVVIALYLDNQHRLLASVPMFAGSINHTQIEPREIARAALRHNAAAVILAHSHPSGEAEPSQADRKITERLQTALQLVDVRLLDHLIVGGRDIVSLAERGWL